MNPVLVLQFDGQITPLDSSDMFPYKPPVPVTSRPRPSFALGKVLAFAQVAQLVEHATENRSVGGSIPSLGTIFFAP